MSGNWKFIGKLYVLRKSPHGKKAIKEALTNKGHMTTPGSDTSFSKMFFVAGTAVVRYKSPFKGFLKNKLQP